MSTPLPAGAFDLIYADPPWRFDVWARVEGDPNHRNPERYYPTMPVADLFALPVQQIAARDSVLLMWATMPLLPDALRLIESWGFTYKTAVFTWVKLTSTGDPFMGLGYYTRANAELCLLATRGKGLPRCDKGVPSVLLSRRREHSRKPDGAYDRIDQLFGTNIRRVELFARRAWPGWESWGLDVPDAAPLGLPLEMAS